MYSLSDVEEIADAPRRTITFWIEQGVIRPEPGTDGAGRGVHRQFSADEVVIACMLRAASQDHVIPYGRLRAISGVLRTQLKSEVAFRKTVNQAVSGEVNLFLILEPKASDGYFRVGVFPVLKTSEDKDKVNLWHDTIQSLIEDSSRETCSKTIVFTNPWLSKVRERLK